MPKELSRALSAIAVAFLTAGLSAAAEPTICKDRIMSDSFLDRYQEGYKAFLDGRIAEAQSVADELRANSGKRCGDKINALRFNILVGTRLEFWDQVIADADELGEFAYADQEATNILLGTRLKSYMDAGAPDKASAIGLELLNSGALPTGVDQAKRMAEAFDASGKLTEAMQAANAQDGQNTLSRVTRMTYLKYAVAAKTDNADLPKAVLDQLKNTLSQDGLPDSDVWMINRNLLKLYIEQEDYASVLEIIDQLETKKKLGLRPSDLYARAWIALRAEDYETARYWAGELKKLDSVNDDARLKALLAATGDAATRALVLSEGLVYADQDLQPVVPPLPNYPQRALRNGLQGHCDVIMDISPDGIPINVQAICSSSLFKRSAERALRKTEFAPVSDGRNRLDFIYPLDYNLSS